ncbi:sensor histidine kinase [Streptococcus pantholopis]|uniref:histidine kinase n=1 Tax=Streptococcus pantholopis TaxID=1811193 RepID=A0A172Q9M0_9STRE|nr:HAMP domain-containing sensor histidine kinase [Streptococcus pantholopis]AND80117.1 two-component sensor histidine kinase [Streptococcus pantholopis]
MKKESLVADFRMTITQIAAATIAATLITWGLAAALFLLEQNRTIYPANYYERQIPAIDRYVRRENINLLSKEKKTGLKPVIKGAGITYQVVDGNASVLYGTNTDPIFSSETDMINHLNTTSIYKRTNTYLHVIPIVSQKGQIKGAVALIYRVKMTSADSGGQWVLGLIAAALFSPVVYIVLFTMLFSKLFIKRINRPLQLLKEAAEKIKNKDLNFEISYYSENELGRLCTAFSEMQQELKASLSAQWEMEQGRVEMVEALAHDLKTPISIVLAYTESLMDGGYTDSKRICRYLSVIEENAKKCSHLVQQIEETSESVQIENELNLVSTDLHDFLAKKVKGYELQAREKDISIVLCDTDCLHHSYLLDTDKLERIFDNIVSNSLRYTPAKGKIFISVLADQATIRYQICDTGCGFSKKDLVHATERFYRGDGSRNSRGSHSGLGLHTVKQLVHQLGGDIELSNGKAGGACLQFSQKNFGNRLKRACHHGE